MMIGCIIVGACVGIVAWLFIHARRMNAEISFEEAAQEPPKTPEEQIEGLQEFSRTPGLSMQEAADALARFKAIPPSTSDVIGILARWDRWKRKFARSKAINKIVYAASPAIEGEMLVLRYRTVFACNPPEWMLADVRGWGRAGEKSRFMLRACFLFGCVGAKKDASEMAAKGVWVAVFEAGGWIEQMESVVRVLVGTLSVGKFTRQDFWMISQLIPVFAADMHDAAFGLPGRDWFDALRITPEITLEWFAKQSEKEGG